MIKPKVLIVPNKAQKLLVAALKKTDELPDSWFGKEDSTDETTLSEESFFEFHDRIKKEGARIIRCTQIDGGERGRRYHVVYVGKKL